MIYAGEQLNYSAGNQYARKYAHESGETMRSLLLWGHEKDAADSIPSILKYTRKNIEFHDGAYKLEDLADYYFVTHDAEAGYACRDLWQPEIDRIVKSWNKATGLIPREKYCSDIDTPVISIQHQRELLAWPARYGADAPTLATANRRKRLQRKWRRLSRDILNARQSDGRSVDPPFHRSPWVENGARPITSTRLGSYWNHRHAADAVLGCLPG
jgi:hypothetical protein